MDLQIESGEYFLSKTEKSAIELQKKKVGIHCGTSGDHKLIDALLSQDAQAEHAVKRQQERNQAFVAPKEAVVPVGGGKQKADEGEVSLEDLKKKFQEKVGFG